MLDIRIELLREVIRGGRREEMWQIKCDSNEGLGV